MPEALTLEGLPADPLELLRAWLAEAEATGMPDANAMTIATTGADGRPSARTVLLRGADADGLRFYTNRESLKGRQLAENPRAQALFFWRELGRQVLVHGPCAPTEDADSDAYFATRPPGSRAGAWASRQGRPLASRAELLAAVEAVNERFAGGEVPRPPHWGGYLLRPAAIEFWQAGEFRLHDRFVYVREAGDWRVERLSP
ncbi:MAG: pyridoxamine 5'-phosphate oxidase [Solirubrobacteraceae bacterium]|nr:pyridoxamine 5'-phosphate oxidase [Solirubrobacteraceae bacterium]